MPGRSLVRIESASQNSSDVSVSGSAVRWRRCARPSDWNYEETHSDGREFAAGGFVHVRLSVGDMHIRRGDSNKISLRYTVKSTSREQRQRRACGFRRSRQRCHD